ncbi:hypothetical protein B9479_006736 [Cryptococcus floricola]|uniref:Zn(2)-C6 fungal-type domain-containing protein n=1 Tax=Cryptococcus floricola TaxID=2591691 RepID=A0A5D3AP67_9TREE|nr:hypothetical protein B9479_006736 [Cryptococcus floricola]
MPAISSDHVHPSEGAAEPPIKKSRRGNRSQPIVSCLECRRMKWKCDRNFPCNNCRKRGLESMCPSGQLSGAKSDRQQVVEMQTRIDELERELHLARQALPTSSTNRPHSHPSDIPTPLLPTSAAPSTSAATRTSPEGLEDGAKSAGKRADHGQLTLGETPGISRFFGGAGTQYLMHSERHSSPASATVPSPSLTMLSSFLPGASKQLSLYQIQSYLPDAITTAHLSGIFFEHGCVNYDIIRNDSFEKIYLAISNTSSSSPPIASARNSKGDENNQHLALVLLVLAVGAQMDTSLPPYNEVGEGLYHLGCIALAHDVSSSITLVQAIIIMSRYESNSGRTVAYEAFWPILGLGIRCAQQIGLHRDGKNWALSDDEIELRRRVYWEMYQEDTLQSMSQGRPRGTNESTVDVIFPTLDPNSMTSKFSRFKYRVSLIFARINSLFSDVKSVSFDQVLALDKATRSLESELPPELVFGSNLPAHQATPRSHFQQLLLRLYLNEAQVVAPSILILESNTDATNTVSSEPLTSPYSFSYVAELESSRIMIDILKSAMAVDPNIAGRYWIFWFHAFMAIHNFSVSVVRSPHSSLAQAALAQIEEGVKLYESVGKGYKAYSDLPIVRQLLTRASEATASSSTAHPLDAPFPADLLGVGTTLRRAKDQPLPSLSTSTSNTRSLLPDLETFPTTIADAIAYQNSLLPTPADLTLASSLSRSLEASGVAEGSSLGHEENIDWPSWGDGDGRGSGENEGSLEYDFDAFLASIIGVDPISLAGFVYDE